MCVLYEHCMHVYDANLREMEVLLLVGLGETESELFCWLASKTYNSLLKLQTDMLCERQGRRKTNKCVCERSQIPLQALSCWVRTLRISLTHDVLISGVGA